MMVTYLMCAVLASVAAESAHPVKAPTTTKIIRFQDEAGLTHTGQYLGGGRAQLLHPESLSPLGGTAQVFHLLAPVPHPPIIIGIGLNYW